MSLLGGVVAWYGYRGVALQHNRTIMSERTGPKFTLIVEDAGDCMVRYCFEKAKYWAIWSGTVTIKAEPATIKRAVCRTHREAIEGKPWNQVSETFRYRR